MNIKGKFLKPREQKVKLMEPIELEILFQILILHISHAVHYERSSLHETSVHAQQETHLLTLIDSNPEIGRFYLQVLIQVQARTIYAKVSYFLIG